MSLDNELDSINTDRLRATFEGLSNRILFGREASTSAVSIQRFPALEQIVHYVDRIVEPLDNEEEVKQIKFGAILAIAMLAEYAVNSQIEDELLSGIDPDSPE